MPSTAAAKPPQPNPPATERQRLLGPTGAPIRPSHWRYLRAKISLGERGIAPTYVAIAKELRLNRVTLWRFLQRHPWLERWVDETLLATNQHLWGLVERRQAMLGIQGVTQAADQFCKMRSGYYTYTRAAETGGGAPGTPTGPVFKIYNLIPRPEPLPVTETVPALPPAAAIPVLSVK